MTSRKPKGLGYMLVGQTFIAKNVLEMILFPYEGSFD